MWLTWGIVGDRPEGRSCSKHRFGTGRGQSMPMGGVGTRVGCIGQGRARVSSYELRSPRDMCAFRDMS